MMDIYDDLDNYLEVHDSEQLLSENKELKMKLEENSQTLNKLKQDFDRLTSEHQLLLKNYSALLKTAKAEIERKTQTIMQINIEKDELFLRLASSRFNGKKPMSQQNNINERLLPQDPKSTVSPDNHVSDATDVSKMEVEGSRNKKHFTRQQKNKIDKSNLKGVQNTTKNVVTNEAKETCRDKENQVKHSVIPDEKGGMMVDTRIQNPSKYTYSSSEEEGEISQETKREEDLRNKLKKTRSQESTHPFSHTKDYTREPKGPKYSRNNEYDIKERHTADHLYRHKDKFKDRKDLKGSAERQDRREYRSRAPERDFSNEKHYQRGRSRHRLESPTDRYSRDKSRGRQYKQDRYVNEAECRVNERNERVKHKASDGDSCEPAKKRRRHSMFEGPEEGRSRRHSEHLEPIDSAEIPLSGAVRAEGDKGSIFCESLSCQSPDDAFAERNVTAQPLKLISHTATTKLDDPRQSSRRYIQIKDKDNKLNLVSARSTKVQLMKVPPWIVIDSKPADEDKVREIYADIDKQIINMSIEADKSSERKDKREKSSDRLGKTTEWKDKANERGKNSTETRAKPTERQEITEARGKSEEKIVIDKNLLSLPNHIITSTLKEEEVKQAIKSLSEKEASLKKYVIPIKVSTNKNETTNFTEANPVPIKKYIIPKKISNIDHENYAKDHSVSAAFDDRNETIVSNKVVKPITNEPNSKMPDKDNVKHKNEKIQNNQQVETKSKEKYISSNPKDKPDITVTKQKGDEIDGNIARNKNEPGTLKPEPCNPLQILFNHLKLAQISNQTQEPTTTTTTTTTNKDDINAKPVENKDLNHVDEKSSTKGTKTVHKSIVEGDLELSDETSDFTQFNDQYTQKTDTPKKKKIKKASPNKAVMGLPNKVVNDANENKSDSENNQNKKAQEIKAKFSDLFGETSCSLITPEDLNLPRPALENYPCMPSMDSTNEPWSLQNSPWKPETDITEQKVDKVTKEVEEKDSKAIKQRAEETNSQTSDKPTEINETAIPKTCDNNKQINNEKLHSEKDLELDKQVLTPITVKPKASLVNGFEKDTPLKALATSTPLRPDEKVTKQKITGSLLSMIPEDSLSKIPETTLSVIPETTLSGIPETTLAGIPETTLSGIQESTVSKISESSKVRDTTTDLLKDLSVSDSSKSHTAAETDTPDVRIVIKRKKRVYKK